MRTDRSLEFWMTQLSPVMRRAPIIHLSIPGSHDSVSYGISSKSGLSPDAHKPLPQLRFLGPLLKRFIVRWCRTQTADIEEQLNGGVRYFDLRIARKGSGLYYVHNLFSVEVAGVLRAVDCFLNAHPHEIVILDCQHFYGFGPNEHRKLVNLLGITFGPKLVLYDRNWASFSLDQLTSQGRQVIVVYRNEISIVEEILFPGTCFPTPWPNTLDCDVLISFLERNLRNRPLKSGYVSQCVLTPTFTFAFLHLCSDLRSKCVLPLEKFKYEWIVRQKNGPKGINVIISDFVEIDDFRFCRQVVSLNRKTSFGPTNFARSRPTGPSTMNMNRGGTSETNIDASTSSPVKKNM